MKVQEKSFHQAACVLNASSPQPLKRTSETLSSLSPKQSSNEDNGCCLCCICNLFASFWKWLIGLCSRKGSQTASTSDSKSGTATQASQTASVTGDSKSSKTATKTASVDSKKSVQTSQSQSDIDFKKTQLLGQKIIVKHLTELGKDPYTSYVGCKFGVILKLDGNIIDCNYGVFNQDSIPDFRIATFNKLQDALEGKDLKVGSEVEMVTVLLKKLPDNKFEMIELEESEVLTAKGSLLSAKREGASIASGLTSREVAHTMANLGNIKGVNFQNLCLFFKQDLVLAQPASVQAPVFSGGAGEITF